ncbi:hypothetical protein ACC616_23920 [Klebsiella pneumoniae]
MKYKEIVYVNAFFVIFAALYSSFAKSDGRIFLLSVLLIPQLIILAPIFWRSSLSKISTLAGDNDNKIELIKPVTFLVTFFFSLLVCVTVYYHYLEGYGLSLFHRGLFVVMMISNAMAITLLVISIVSSYSIFVRMVSKGYRRILR